MRDAVEAPCDPVPSFSSVSQGDTEQAQRRTLSLMDKVKEVMKKSLRAGDREGQVKGRETGEKGDGPGRGKMETTGSQND